jgi:hypothetical protein
MKNGKKEGVFVDIGGVRTDLTSGMLDAIAHPPPGFTSKHSYDLSDVAGRFWGLPWCSRCGKGSSQLSVTMPLRWVPSWREAGDTLAKEEWHDAQLEAQNQLTLWLHIHAREAYQSWNERVQRMKTGLVEPLSTSILMPQQERLALPIAFLHSIQWDMLGAAMENESLPEGHSAFFFLELLSVYEAGHLPCGWIGRWPEGQLVVL